MVISGLVQIRVHVCVCARVCARVCVRACVCVHVCAYYICTCILYIFNLICRCYVCSVNGFSLIGQFLIGVNSIQ